MFDKARERFASFITPTNVKAYTGTDEVYNEQILEPLRSGTKKNTFQNSDAEKIATAVTCIKVLGDTLSRLPINVYQTSDAGNVVDKEDYRYDLLHFSPDGMMTSNVLFGALEYQRNLKGNAFARIYRDKLTGRAKSLEFIPSNSVGGYKKVRGQLFYIVYEKNTKGDTKEIVVNGNDMLHFKMITKNGYWGINPIEAQRLNLSTLYKGKNTVDSFYENNAFSPMALKSQIPDAQFQKQFGEAMKSFKSNNVGPANAGEVIKLPPFTEIQQLSLDPVDSKFIESMKFDSAQIASFYGVPVEMIGIWEHSKFSNVEQNQINFRTNTMSAILRMYRSELEMKLLTTQERKTGKSIEFVTQALMETDVATRSDYYKTMFDLGVMTQNQIALLEGMPTFKDGDKHYMSSQTTAIEDRDSETKDIDI
jgi:HK97 family phage portal protein